MTNLRVYAAGKIAKNDWRQVRDAWGGPLDGPWPVITDWLPGLDYVGPFFAGCDHGCTHGRGTHALDIDCSNNHPEDWRNVAVERCYGAIDKADLLFAWLNDVTAYGTLVEIGYARARGIPVVVGTPEVPEYNRDALWHGLDEGFFGKFGDLWFAFTTATAVIEAQSPRDALAYMLIMDTVRDIRDLRRMIGEAA